MTSGTEEQLTSITKKLTARQYLALVNRSRRWISEAGVMKRRDASLLSSFELLAELDYVYDGRPACIHRRPRDQQTLEGSIHATCI
jgi:hypothetical protein